MQDKRAVVIVVLSLPLVTAISLAGEQDPAGGTPQPATVDVVGKASVSRPSGWLAPKPTYRNATELFHPGLGKPAAEARVIITTETRRDHADAVRRLADIAQESTAKSTFMIIDGWPALERRDIVDTPVPSHESEEKKRGDVPPKTLQITTAVAAGDLLVRIEGSLLPEAADTLGRDVEAIGRSLKFTLKGDPTKSTDEVKRLERAPSGGPDSGADTEHRVPSAPARGGEPPSPTVATQIQAGRGEIEAVASADGQTVIVAANPGRARSTDGGLTFASMGALAITFPADGDPTLGVGQSGDFYFEFIGWPTTAQPAGTAVGCTNSLMVSTAGGPFTYRSNAVVCPNVAAGSSTCLPDQEHMTADPRNAALGGDQLYSVWRNFTATPTGGLCKQIGSGVPVPSMVCSQDGGTNWTMPSAVGTGDMPRVTTGPDGSVWVVYRTGSTITLNKFSSCSAGLVQQTGFPVTIASVTSTCPIAGLDRCHWGIATSPMVAVDDLDSTHLYAAYSTTTVAGNQDVIARDSTDGGATWPRSVRLNTAINARRFMPWACALGGRVHVGWYDRRNSTAASNDVTAYYRGSAAVEGGLLVAGPELNLAGVDDPQCASGWPCSTDSTGASDTCSVQPQLAGRCRNAMAGGSGTPCDYDTAACPTGETCQATGGCPKYGDYNGIACAGGRVFAAWASATPPPTVAATGAGIRIFGDVGLAPDEFYVRDWTTSGSAFDNGVEPGTNPVIWETSDVWNRQADGPGPLSLAAPPVSESAKRSADPSVLNYAFVRVSRRAPAAGTAPDVTLDARFFYADYGAGLNFVPIGAGTPTPLVFAAADNTKVLTSGYPWHLAETASQHACLAVEITAPDDSPIPPSITTAGAGGAMDYRMREDNNKAQRNLETVLVTTAGTQASATSWYAQLHNPDGERRDVRLLVQVNPKALRQFRNAKVSLVGGKAVTLADKRELVAERMEPGERRWVALTVNGIKARQGDTLPVSFAATADGQSIGGFTIGLRVAPLSAVAFQNISVHQGEMARLASGFGIEDAREEADAAAALLRSAQERGKLPRIDEGAYLEFLARRARAWRALIKPLLARTVDTKDVFDLMALADRLARAGGRRSAEAATAAHTALLEAMDATQTRLQRERGDRADIPQILRWQNKLLRNLRAERSEPIVDGTAAWLADYDRRKVSLDDYPKLVVGLLDDYATLAKNMDPHGPAPELVADMRRALKSPDGLEGAHRQLLLRLRDAVK